MKASSAERSRALESVIDRPRSLKKGGERKMPKIIFEEPTTPYFIAEALSAALKTKIAPQRIYSDRSAGKLAATKDKESGKWIVSVSEANRYCESFITGKRSKAKPSYRIEA